MRSWLKQIRLDKKYTQEFVAGNAGISRVFYTEIENGAKNPSVSTAQSIANVLNFDWTKFFK